MDYSHYLYLRKEVDVERLMAREDARSSSSAIMIVISSLSGA